MYYKYLIFTIYEGEEMDNSIDERVYQAAKIFLDHFSTVREVAKKMGCSKSTIHKDFTERLPELNFELYKKVKDLLDYNKKVRHIRGGEATRRRYIQQHITKKRKDM